MLQLCTYKLPLNSDWIEFDLSISLCVVYTNWLLLENCQLHEIRGPLFLILS